jgi:hypothetical protein
VRAEDVAEQVLLVTHVLVGRQQEFETWRPHPLLAVRRLPADPIRVRWLQLPHDP